MLTSERFRTAKTQTGHQKTFRCRLVRLSMLKLGDGVRSRSRDCDPTGININWSKRTGRLQLASISPRIFLNSAASTQRFSAGQRFMWALVVYAVAMMVCLTLI